VIDTISVREYARLTTDEVTNTLDQARISESAFDWLCTKNATFTKAGAALVLIEGRRWLKLDNHVGVLETPCGTRIEILPKHTDEADNPAESRRILCRMLQQVLNLPTRELGPASISVVPASLTEWVIGQFLAQLDHLIKRGVRFDYQRIEEEQSYLRGQLNAVGQMRQPPGRQHHFQIRHDVFTADRAENRLLQSALHKVCRATHDPANWRLAHELRGQFHEVRPSPDVQADLKAWRNDRLMAHYQAIRPWCELVLGRQMPMAVAGDWHGISLLFPMEKLFERYVGTWLKNAIVPGAQLEIPLRIQHLCRQGDKNMFELKPDFVVRLDNRRWVLDAKWKRLNSMDQDSKYDLQESDFYQMYAYGQTYLKGRGQMLLIYPRTASFRTALESFRFDELTLDVVPFDLSADRLVGASGDWLQASS
jgi:5-methylcytosine-specific restriction enzyme subunit McrC